MIVKRLFDVVAALAGLAVLSPLLLVLGVWVRLDSPGPALFRQERVGRNGARFRILKFRTMRSDSDGLNLQVTASGDRRITRAGAVLRHYKLDELPQLINVLRGEMSLVGPRPEVPRYVVYYPAATRELVLSVRPGITDSAAIVFRDESSLLAAAKDPEATYIHEILPRKLALYADYVRTRSFFGDLMLILKTVRAIF